MTILNRLRLLPDECRSALRRAALWMTAAAILDGLTGLALLVVIEPWFDKDPSVLRGGLALIGLTLVQSLVLYRAARLGFVGGSGLAAGLVMRLVERLPKLNPFALARLAPPSTLLRGPVMRSMAIPAHLLNPLVSALITPIVVIAGLAFLDLRAALALLVAGSCLGLALRWSAQRTSAAENAYLAAEQDVVAQVQDFADHQVLLRSAGQAGPTHRRLQGAIESLRADSRTLLGRTLPGSLVFGLLVQANFVAILFVGAWMIEQGRMDGVRLVAILLLLMRFMEPLTQLVHLDQALRTARQALDTLLNILDLPALVSPAVGKTPDDAGLEVRALGFALDDGRVLLSAVQCHIAPGTLTAIVGPSGAGKTTLLGLLARLFDPTEGVVLLGRVDIRDFAETSLTATRNLVPQDNGLFRGTVAWNLRMAKPGASLDELYAAAKDAALLPEIEHWPERWDRDVGPSGSLLSGGQRQRLCLARGFLAPAPILLLDEPTASLDALSEDRVLRSLAASRGRRTVVAVTHNPALARLADQIIVLEQGHIRAAGIHCELYAQDQWYARFADAGQPRFDADASILASPSI